MKIEQQAVALIFPNRKTQCVHFCQLHKQHDDPVLHLYGSHIPIVEESKFLGMMFYRKLSVILLIIYLNAKYLKALHLLKVLSHTSWGALPNYTSQALSVSRPVKIRLCLQNIWLSTNSYLQMPIHNRGAFRTSPVDGLYVEEDEPYIFTKRETLFFNMI